jgi:hypothetical protein
MLTYADACGEDMQSLHPATWADVKEEQGAHEAQAKAERDQQG